MTPVLRVEQVDRTVVLTIDRPAARNAIDEAVLTGLDAALNVIAGDPEVRAVVITGAGDKAFAAGGDIATMRSFSAVEAEAFSAGVLESLPAIVAVSCPSVASYLRLQPHRWAGPWACRGRENREAGLRFVTGMVGSRSEAANLEIKPVDGGGNPYLVLGSVVAAGLVGLERDMRLPEPTSEDPASLSAAVPASVVAALAVDREAYCAPMPALRTPPAKMANSAASCRASIMICGIPAGRVLQ